MDTTFPYTQIRVARHTAQLELIIDFYRNGLGLPEIGRFRDHEGYSGVMLGLPGESYHLEFTEHKHGAALPAPGKDNLLVFYLPGIEQRDAIAQRLLGMGYPATEPENPYWKTHGITIEDPDRCRIVLMAVSGFKSA